MANDPIYTVNQSLNARLTRDQNGQITFRRDRVHLDLDDVVKIRGQGSERTPIDGSWQSRLYAGLSSSTRGYQTVGPALLNQNITDAFDFYLQGNQFANNQGMKFAMPNATLPPYDHKDELNIEELHICGAIAMQGVIGKCKGSDAIWNYVGNSYAINLPDCYVMSKLASNDAIHRGVLGLLKATLLIKAQRDAIINQWPNCQMTWYQINRLQEFPMDDLPKLITVLAANMTTAHRVIMMNVYVGIFLAYSQKGRITQKRLDKVVEALLVMNLPTTVTKEVVRDLYVKFGSYFDDVAAELFFPRWASRFADSNLHMKLVMQQVTNGGLCMLTLIRQILCDFPDFPWKLLESHYPVEWQRFKSADDKVGSNIFMDSRRVLADVGVQNYVPIAFCAKRLVQEITRDKVMANLLSLNHFTVPDEPFINTLIQRYQWAQSKKLEAGSVKQ